MNTNISTDELISFKQDLTLFQEEKISEVLLAPLGEYWSIRFIRAKDGVKIQGNICDKNIISLQHNLTLIGLSIKIGCIIFSRRFPVYKQN